MNEIKKKIQREEATKKKKTIAKNLEKEIVERERETIWHFRYKHIETIQQQQQLNE